MEAKVEVVSNARRRFIKRERIRREMCKALEKGRPGETITMPYEYVEVLTEWIKELERRVGVLNGNA